MTNKEYRISEGSIQDLEEILNGNKIAPDILVEDPDLINFYTGAKLSVDSTEIDTYELISVKVKAEFVGILSYKYNGK